MPTEYSPMPRDTIGEAEQTSIIDPSEAIAGAIEVTVQIERRELMVLPTVIIAAIKEAAKGRISCSEIVVTQTLCFTVVPTARAVRMAE